MRWYPPSWRECHEEEFAALLEDSIADRHMWPRRGFNIAIEGLRLRVAQVLSNAGTLPQARVSPSSAWRSFAAMLFVGYTILMVSSELPLPWVSQRFENVANPLTLLLGTILEVGALCILLVGVRALRQARSLRKSWPCLVLGISVLGLLSLDWWITSLKGMGWNSAGLWRYAVISLNPFAWSSAFASHHAWDPLIGNMRWTGYIGDHRLYLVLNFMLLLSAALSSSALLRRLSSSNKPQVLRKNRLGIATGTSVVLVICATWGWWIAASERLIPLWMHPGQEQFFIAILVTFAAISSVTIRVWTRRRPGISAG
jgi:hypothetical protein